MGNVDLSPIDDFYDGNQLLASLLVGSLSLLLVWIFVRIRSWRGLPPESFGLVSFSIWLGAFSAASFIADWRLAIGLALVPFGYALTGLSFERMRLAAAWPGFVQSSSIVAGGVGVTAVCCYSFFAVRGDILTNPINQILLIIGGPVIAASLIAASRVAELLAGSRPGLVVGSIASVVFLAYAINWAILWIVLALTLWAIGHDWLEAFSILGLGIGSILTPVFLLSPSNLTAFLGPGPAVLGMTYLGLPGFVMVIAGWNKK